MNSIKCANVRDLLFTLVQRTQQQHREGRWAASLDDLYSFLKKAHIDMNVKVRIQLENTFWKQKMKKNKIVN